MTSNDQQTTLTMLNKMLEQDYSCFVEAEAAFLEKYSMETYKIFDPEGGAPYQHHQFILENYGNKLIAISIEGVDLIDEVIDSADESNWLIKLLTQNCTGLKKLELAHLDVDLSKIFSSLQNLTHCSLSCVSISGDDWTEHRQQYLKHLKIKSDIRLESSSFERFINNNSQIETLDLNTNFNSLNIIHDKLNVLKKLKIEGPYNLTSDHEMMKLDSLESLEINCFDIVPVLQQIQRGSNNIEELALTLTRQPFEDTQINEDALITVICSFDKLTSLTVTNVKFTEIQIELFGQMKHLTSLCVEMKVADDLANQILNLVPKLAVSTELRLKFDIKHRGGFNYDFHRKFLEASAKSESNLNLILMFQDNEELVFSKEQILHIKNGSAPVLLHWIGYEVASSTSKINMFDLKEDSLRHLLDSLDLLSLVELKQTCRTLQMKVNEYIEAAYQTRVLICNASDHTSDLGRVLQSFGQYFRTIRIEIPSLCEQTEVFDLINRFCKNVTELQLVNRSFTDRLVNPVQFSLPNLKHLHYQNDNDIEVEISAFANRCPMLKRLVIKSTGRFESNLDILKLDDSFVNLAAIEMSSSLEMAINLLENLSTNVANQLHELSITTPVYLIEDNEKQLTDVIKRFQSLNILHLIMPNNYLDSQSLFSHCQRITELSILTESEDYEITKTTLNHIQMHCKNLRNLHVYNYYDSVPVDVLKVAFALFPSVNIKSIQMDTYGMITKEHKVDEEWLNQYSDENE